MLTSQMSINRLKLHAISHSITDEKEGWNMPNCLLMRKIMDNISGVCKRHCTRIIVYHFKIVSKTLFYIMPQLCVVLTFARSRIIRNNGTNKQPWGLAANNTDDLQKPWYFLKDSMKTITHVKLVYTCILWKDLIARMDVIITQNTRK